MKPGHSSTTGRTRHLAKEFLDESVLNTATRKLKTPTEQFMRRPPLSNIVSTDATSSAAPQQVILLQPTPSSVAPGGEQAFLLASTGGEFPEWSDFHSSSFAYFFILPYNCLNLS